MGTMKRGVNPMSWTLVRYTCVIALLLFSIQNVRMALIYMGFVRSGIGIGAHLPFATDSLARAANFAAYSAILFCLVRGIAVAAAVIVFWAIRRFIRAPLRRLWFRYLAHLFLDIERRLDPSAPRQTSGPEFQTALDAVYRVIESEHVPVLLSVRKMDLSDGSPREK